MSLLFPVFNKALHFEKSFTSSTILQFVLMSHIFSQFNIEVLSYIFGFQLNFYIMYFNCSHVSAYCVNSYNDSMLSLAQIIVLWEHFLNLKREQKKKDLFIFLEFSEETFYNLETRSHSPESVCYCSLKSNPKRWQLRKKDEPIWFLY